MSLLLGKTSEHKFEMAAEFFEGVGQVFAGTVGVAVTLGLNEDVKRWTEKGGRKIQVNAEKAWGKDGEVTKFAESLPGIRRSDLKNEDGLFLLLLSFLNSNMLENRIKDTA